MEGFIVIIGLCVSFVPALMYANYIITKSTRETKFDIHLANVRDKKGRLGVIVAYLERILFGTVITSLGVTLSENFKNDTAIEILIVAIVIYIIVKFFDERFEN